jgi:hypothetical protein
VLYQRLAVDEASLLKNDGFLNGGLASEQLFRQFVRRAVTYQDFAYVPARLQGVLLGFGDEFFNQSLNLFSPRMGRPHISMPNKLPSEVRQQVLTLIRR